MEPLNKTFLTLVLLACASAVCAPIEGVEFDGNFHSSNTNDRYGVIVLAGSGGGKDDETARDIAEMGYQVLSLAYFDRDGSPLVPETLELIPLEYFAAPKQWLMDRPDTRNDGVIVYGSSKGAELALLLSAHDSDYKAAIALAPSHVAWQGVPRNFAELTSAPSSWSIDGEGIPFVPYVSNEEKERLGFDNRHEASLQNEAAVVDALISVENIDAPILLLSGGKDESWPAATMGRQVCTRRRRHGNLNDCLHKVFEEGDHLLTTHPSEWSAEVSGFLASIHEK